MTTERRIYLDHSASAPPDPSVVEAVAACMSGTYGNASSVHAPGRRAKAALEESRESFARLINAEPAEVYFTGGGTESDNHALTGAVAALRRREPDAALAVSAVEHHAVLECAGHLAGTGVRVVQLPVGSDGVLNLGEAERLIPSGPGVTSVMLVNNETGAVQPVTEVASLVRTRNGVMHTDAVQAFGKLAMDVRALGADIVSFSGHKIGGPKGVGALYVRRGTEVDALLYGGAQERKMRAGTENVPLIVGFARAAELAERNRTVLREHASACRSMMLDTLRTDVPGLIINAEGTGVPHILSISLDPAVYEADGEALLMSLDLQGVAASSGSACTSGSVQPSHVLLAMGRDERTTRATVRFSFGAGNTLDDARHAAGLFRGIITRFLRTSTP